MAGVAAGMATTGLRPICSTYAVFMSMRACETIRQSVCYPNLDVKFVATHGGLATGIDGVSHQAVEDICIFRSLANMRILVPSDANMVYPAYKAALAHKGPVYIRLTRDAIPVLYDSEEKAKVEIQYKRWVSREGNAKARERIDEVFQVCDAAWRGLGTIPKSGLEMRPELRALDGLAELGVEVPAELENPGCSCGLILRGLIDPPECPLFAKKCTPTSPVGPCMVSTEGSCAAFYKYGER